MRRTREEHLQWCKSRALEYLNDGEVANACASFLSDMGKHPETKNINPILEILGLQAAMQNDREAARRWIIGFH